MVIADDRKNPSKSFKIKRLGTFTCLLGNDQAEEEYIYAVKFSKLAIWKKIKPDNAQNNAIKSMM